MSNIENIIPLSLPKGFKAVVTEDIEEEEKKTIRPPFLFIGKYSQRNSTMKINGIEVSPRDLLTEIENITPRALSTLNIIRKNMDYYNTSNYAYVKLLTEADKRKFRVGFKELKEKDMAIKVKNNVYMLNPLLIIPVNFEIALTEYTKLKE